LARATSGASSVCAPAAPADTNNTRPKHQRIRLHCSTILTGAKDIQAAAPTWLVAVRAAQSKKAADTQVLDLRGITSFADFFVISTGANQRQVQAISDEVGLQLKQQAGELPFSIEGYNQAEWVLADYGDLLVHIFSPKAREYYSLERLWRSAKMVEIPSE
jgi:ribosome-associated protein